MADLGAGLPHEVELARAIRLAAFGAGLHHWEVIPAETREHWLIVSRAALGNIERQLEQGTLKLEGGRLQP